MNKLVTANLVDGAAGRLRHEQADDRHEARQPEGREDPRRPRRPSAIVSLCGETVPCGKYAAQILQTAGVTIPETSVTRGQDVKATLAAVTTGDADAAIVYVTDAKAAGDAGRRRRRSPTRENAIATYPIATLTASTNKDTSQAFIDYVTSSKGQATLQFVRVPATVVRKRGAASAVARGARRARRVRVHRAARSSDWSARSPWSDLWTDLERPGGDGRAAALARLLALGHGACRSLFGVPLAWVLARVEFPGRSLVARPRAAAAGGPAGRRRRRALLRVRPRRASSASTSTTGSASSSRSRPRARSWPRRSSRCRSS